MRVVFLSILLFDTVTLAMGTAEPPALAVSPSPKASKSQLFALPASPTAETADRKQSQDAFAKLTDDRIEKVLAAWNLIKKKFPRNEGRESALGKLYEDGRVAGPEEVKSTFRKLTDLAVLEREIGMSWEQFDRDQALLLMVYGHIEAASEMKKLHTETSVDRQELKRLLEDPSIRPEQRELMKKQQEALDQMTAETTKSPFDIPDATIQRVGKYQSRIKEWLDWNSGPSETQDSGEDEKTPSAGSASPQPKASVGPARR